MTAKYEGPECPEPYNVNCACPECKWCAVASVPGAPEPLRYDGELVAEVEDYIRTGPTPIDAVARILDAIDRRSALRGQEGAKRREGMEQGAPLSGLDAATVEACAREALSVAWDSDDVAEYALTVAARIRALATPPGQATKGKSR